MPRTKLQRLGVSKVEIEESIIRQAMARQMLYKDSDLAEKLQTDAGYISKCFKKGFSDGMKMRLRKILRFKTEEWDVISRGDKDDLDIYWRCIDSVSFGVSHPAGAGR